jgi:hypothetical protein
VKKHETSCNGKRRYRCLNQDCLYVTFSQSLDYPGRRREVKQQIVEMTLNGSGVRDISRVVQVSTATVIQELKKPRNCKLLIRERLETVASAPTRATRGVIEQVEVGEETTVVESELDEMYICVEKRRISGGCGTPLTEGQGRF